ncbi:MAG: ATP-grasp domain-containing protein [Cyanobacteria bacterium J06641_5]
MLSDRYHPTQLLEYQAKELLRSVGVTLLPAQNLHSPAQVRDLRLPYPIALKSQVPDRDRAGGIRFAANAIDAFASARAIFNLAIDGEHPEALLAEVRFQSEREYYLAVVLDDQLQRPVLVGALLDADGQAISCYRVAVEAEFSPYYARRLSLRLGLVGEEMLAVGTIVEKMYRLLVAKDLARIEIDPLAIDRNGELAILDAKVFVDRRALGRHPDLAAWLPARAPHAVKFAPQSILLLGDCESLLLAMGDLLAAAPTAVPWEVLSVAADTELDALVAQIHAAGVVVASFGGDSTAALLVAEAIARAAANLAGTAAAPPIVLRIVGGPPAAVRERLANIPICWPQDLEAAIAKALELLSLSPIP